MLHVCRKFDVSRSDRSLEVVLSFFVVVHRENIPIVDQSSVPESVKDSGPQLFQIIIANG